MHTPFSNHTEFESKAELLARALALPGDQARTLLARIAGHADAEAIVYGDGDRSLCSSREELIARLQASRPELGGEQAAQVIDSLQLTVRDADIEHLPDSPGVVPNMGG